LLESDGLMPDINNAVALGVRPPPPQTLTDIIAPITSLAQLQYLGANADRVKAETTGLQQNAQFAAGKLAAIQSYNDKLSKGIPPERAVIESGLSNWDPVGANATLGNIKSGREIEAVRNYKPGDPTSLAGGGPELVGKELTNQSTAATTAKTSAEASEKSMQLWGQVGTIMVSPGGATPQGRQIAADVARKAGVPEDWIQQFLKIPDQQYVLAGQHLQMASMKPELYLDKSGQAEYNQGLAKVATSNEKLGPGEVPNRGPAAYAVTHGQPVPPMPGPSSGIVGQPSLGNFGAPQTNASSLSAAGVAPGQPGGLTAAPQATPSLGNFAPAAAQPQPGGTILAGPGAAPVPGGLTPVPAAPVAATSGIAPAAPAVRNVNAVATPSVGVSVPSVVTAAGAKYGISPDYMARTFQIESGGNPNAYNAQSKAAGPFQFVPSTGAKYLNGASPFDVAGSADAAARLAADNRSALTQALGRAPTDAELYLAHQQGAAGAAKLLANPNARAGDLVGNSAIAANGGNPNAPASAFTNLWATKFNGGVGRSIPAAAVAPNVTPISPAAAPGIVPGAIPPLATALSPPAASGATPVALPAPAAPPAIGPAADNALPLGYRPVDAGPSKALLAEQEEQGKAYGKLPEELDKAAAAAKTTNSTLDEMAAATDGWRQGKWSDVQENKWREPLQAVANQLGVNTPDLDKSVANYQDFVKLSGNILRQASHETSSRVGVQEMSLIAKSLPNPEMSADGFKQVASQLKGLNDFQIAKQQAATAWKADNGGSLGPNKTGQDFQTAWNASASPAAFVLHRMEQEDPAAVNNLISTMRKTPEGLAALKNITAQTRWASDQGLLR
jgi:hypothetical protein